MSNINKDTIIQQCADGYRTASGTTEAVKYGELGNKIAELSGGGGGLDYTVTFTVEGESYEIVGVKSGQTVSAPNVNPLKEDYIFSGWKRNGETVTFPITEISSDITITGSFISNLIFYAPLSSSKSTAETGQALTVNGGVIPHGSVNGVPCAQFNGTSYITSNQTEGFVANYQPWSVSFWQKNPNNTLAETSIIIGTSSFSNRIGSFCLQSGYSGYATGSIWAYPPDFLTSTITARQWHHSCITYDGSKTYLYIDGVLIMSSNYNGYVPSNANTVTIGADFDGDDKYNGYIAAVRIYNVALSQAKITALASEFTPTDGN